MNLNHIVKTTFLFIVLAGSAHSINATEQPPANNGCGMNTNNCQPEKLIIKEKCGMNTNNCSQSHAATTASTGNAVITAPAPKRGGLDRDIIRRMW